MKTIINGPCFRAISMEFEYQFFGQLKNLEGSPKHYDVEIFDRAFKRAVCYTKLNNLELNDESVLENIIERSRYQEVILPFQDSFKIYESIKLVENPAIRDFAQEVLSQYRKLKIN